MTLHQKLVQQWRLLIAQERLMQKKVEDYNSYRDFHDREVEGHIIAAFMVLCGMEKMEGVYLSHLC